MAITKSTPLPTYLLPMLATSTQPFDDADYLFEKKWDGVRALTSITKDGIHIWGREGIDYTQRYPEFEELRRLPQGTMLDGELVMTRDGRPDFHMLMSQRHTRRPRRTPFLCAGCRIRPFRRAILPWSLPA